MTLSASTKTKKGRGFAAKLSITWSAATAGSNATPSLSTCPRDLLCLTLPCPHLVVFHSLPFIVLLSSSPFPPHSSLSPLYSLTSSPSSPCPPTPLTRAILCQMAFYPSQQSLSVRGPFRVHIGREGRQTWKSHWNWSEQGKQRDSYFLCVASYFSPLFVQFFSSSLPRAQIYIVCGDSITQKADWALIHQKSVV